MIRCYLILSEQAAGQFERHVVAGLARARAEVGAVAEHDAERAPADADLGVEARLRLQPDADHLVRPGRVQALLEPAAAGGGRRERRAVADHLQHRAGDRDHRVERRVPLAQQRLVGMAQVVQPAGVQRQVGGAGAARHRRALADRVEQLVAGQMLVHRIDQVVRARAQFFMQRHGLLQRARVDALGVAQHLQPHQALVQLLDQLELDVALADQAGELQQRPHRGARLPAGAVGTRAVVLELLRQELDAQEGPQPVADRLLVDHRRGRRRSTHAAAR